MNYSLFPTLPFLLRSEACLAPVVLVRGIGSLSAVLLLDYSFLAALVVVTPCPCFSFLLFHGWHFLFPVVVFSAFPLLFHSLCFSAQSVFVPLPVFLAAVSVPWLDALVAGWLFPVLGVFLLLLLFLRFLLLRFAFSFFLPLLFLLFVLSPLLLLFPVFLSDVVAISLSSPLVLLFDLVPSLVLFFFFLFSFSFPVTLIDLFFGCHCFIMGFSFCFRRGRRRFYRYIYGAYC